MRGLSPPDGKGQRIGRDHVAPIALRQRCSVRRHQAGGRRRERIARPGPGGLDPHLARIPLGRGRRLGLECDSAISLPTPGQMHLPTDLEQRQHRERRGERNHRLDQRLPTVEQRQGVKGEERGGEQPGRPAAETPPKADQQRRRERGQQHRPGARRVECPGLAIELARAVALRPQAEPDRQLRDGLGVGLGEPQQRYSKRQAPARAQVAFFSRLERRLRQAITIEHDKGDEDRDRKCEGT